MQQHHTLFCVMRLVAMAATCVSYANTRIFNRYFWYFFKLSIESGVFHIPLIFFIMVLYMVNNTDEDESHIFGQ